MDKIMSDQLTEQFTHRIITLQQRVHSIHEDFANGRHADWAEQAGERENDEVLNALESEAKIEIQQLSNAISLIQAGQYGICQQCKEPIAKARLAVQPSAIRCIACAS
jgi:RNA polymerase-binding transcription factor DksA